MVDKQQISTFLHYGRLIKIENSVKDESWAQEKEKVFEPRAATADEPELIELGVKSLKIALTDITAGDTNIIPLSGGLDSRAILGGLFETGLKDKIITVTVGSPGTFDYDIGEKVAKQFGVPYEMIDLTKIEIKQELLEETAKKIQPWMILFDAFFIRLISDRFGNNVTYWSGHVGDDLAGSHLPPKDSKSWQEALEVFARRNRFSRTISLTPPDFQPTGVLPVVPLLENSILNYDAQLHFILRQEAYMRPLIMPPPYDYRAPFTHPKWVSFILSVPRKYREGMHLYKLILKKAFPELFSLPTKENYGLPLGVSEWARDFRKLKILAMQQIRNYLPDRFWKIFPGSNYLDFGWALRRRDDLKKVVYRNIRDLKRRGIVTWLDLDEIWENHQNKNADYSRALIIFASLEIYFKVYGVSNEPG